MAETNKGEMNFIDRICSNCCEKVDGWNYTEGQKAWYGLKTLFKFICALILLFLFPIGTIIAVFWMANLVPDGYKCPHCGKKDLVAVDSQKGKKILKEYID